MSSVRKEKGTYEDLYWSKAVPALMQKFGYKNPMMVPRLEKIAINICMKEAVKDKKVIDMIYAELGAIAGQRPIYTRAKKDISNFKLRKGQVIGCAVTLRKKKMYEMLNRLVNVALPRVRDFKGISPKAFDGFGNYTLGLTEQIVFPEINADKVNWVAGMSISFVTTAKNNEEGKFLLKEMGFPFREASNG